MARIALALVFLLVLVSAYLRLVHSGVGCDDWPSCYGRIGDPPGLRVDVGPFERHEAGVEQQALAPAGATFLHRLVASVLGVIVLLLTVNAMRRRRNRIAALALLSCTVFLAFLGLRSGSLHSPAIVMGNLAGGFSMLALLAWMVFSRSRNATGEADAMVRGLAAFAVAVLGAQILLGGLTSANFAATACRTLPDCHGSWVPGPALSEAFNLHRQHPVDEAGVAIGGAGRAAIHQMHRLGAVVTAVALLAAGFAALRAGGPSRGVAVVIVVLVVAELAVGIAAVVTRLPIALAVAHNALAALLLLSVIRLFALNLRVSVP